MNDSPQREVTHRSDQVAGGGLKSRSFLGLMVTQFLGAANDNILRWLVIGVGKQYVAPSDIRNILMAGTACFVLPYLLLAAPAGYLADRFSKRTVIVACKLAEIVIMTLAATAIFAGNIWFLFAIVALMGAQSALFGPSKLGSIPEMLSADRISAANGLIGLTTVCATVIGMAGGNVLSDLTGYRGQEQWWLSAAVLIGIAVLGWLTSMGIAHLPAANPSRVFSWNFARQTVRDLATLASKRPVLRVALGITFFWSLGALAQLNIDQFAFEGGATAQSQIVPLLLSLVMGVGLGSILAGVWSGGRVELGILPLGAGGVAISSVLLFTIQGTLIYPTTIWTASYTLACFFLFTLGVSAGLFDVPLAAYMQHRSPPRSRGSILAACNFMTFAGILITALLFSALRTIISGSLDGVAALDSIQLNAEAQRRVETKRDQFSGDWRAGAPPRLTEFLADSSVEGDSVEGRGVDGGERTVLLAHLLWVELNEKQDRGEFLDLDHYQSEFPDQRLLVAQVYTEVVGHPFFSSRQIFLLCGLLTVPVFIYIVWLIPQASIRFLVWLASHTAYRVRVHGADNLPAEGGALLVANHVSWLDGILLLITSSRPVRLIIYADWIRGRLARLLARTMGAIPIKTTPKAARIAIDTARRALENGELVCIFPEGGMTRTGQLQAFKPGLMEIVKGTTIPVVPVYLDELWGSIFSFRGGKAFWKWPRRWSNPVSIWFGPKISHPSNVHIVRQAVQDLGAEAVQERKTRSMNLPRAMLRTCRKAMFRRKVADSSGTELSGGSLLMRTLILRRLLLRDVIGIDERHVGLLLPPSVGGVVANAAVTLANRITANLNYTVSSDTMNACLEVAGIRHVLTSRKVTEKLDLTIDAELIYLEELRDKVTLVDKLVSWVQTYLLPAFILERILGLHEIDGDDILTVVFTSGSTGHPKGVMLTQHNIASNVDAIDQVVQIRTDDVILGILPFFHSFGFTVTLWTVLGLDVQGVYHFTPLDARQVGKMCARHRATILLSTPTFLRSYLKRCPPKDLSSLEVVVVGAEKMSSDLASAFEEKFGLRPVEGYGATELSPLVSINIPPTRAQSSELVCKEGTVGRPVPGVSAKIVDPDTFQDVPVGASGMLLIKGPNVMAGYLGQPEKTAEVIRDGWYVTGDIAVVDADGFIQITDRQSRFSKIGGEMVPHIRIEETLQKIVSGEDEDEFKAVVTTVPDVRKGEKLVVIHTELPSSPDEICQQLAEARLPNLWIPSPDSFHQVPEIPLLGSGKVDFRAIKQLAMEADSK